MSFAAAGFVLAGGRSSRMGRNKALLGLEGETLLVRGLRQLSEVCAEVAIAGGSRELAAFGRLVPDQSPGEGPLSGIVAALTSSTREWNLFCPVDVPFIPKVAWLRMLRRAEGTECGAVLARVSGQVQPLCGLYHQRMLPGLETQLQTGQRKVTAAVAATVEVCWVSFDEPGEQSWFRNINTPEEYAQLAHPKRQDP